ncbi:YebY family protein [bacterium]|nr:YebY family protein [bacterium]
MRKLHLFAIATVLPVMLLTGCGSSGTKITQAEYGDKWPFTVNEGTLSCRETGRVVGTTKMVEVTFTANGITYALNGTAKQNNSYANVDSIWAKDTSLPGTKKDIGPIIDRGLALAN